MYGPRMNMRDIDKIVRVEPGKAAKLPKRDTTSADLFEDKKAAEEHTKACAKAIDALQDRLWAERKRSLLVVLQGIDTSGKDGTVRGVFNACGPLGVNVTSFGRPSEEELAHDYLWRVHMATPKRGVIGVFNRSHYEDVLVVKVRNLAPAEDVERRYEQINAFEKQLSENGVTILKFMLHISKDEQAKRLQERLDEPEKNWKFNAGDLEDRALWDAYQDAYDVALTRCSTEHAPWRVVPADKKWRRNAIIAAIVRGTLEEMNPSYPRPDWKASDFKII
ncbi:UDP-galactose-lipid carrier transferase [alpha proteobacterium U9-1i]|nr:UDP-galactose-lipid carrier transferase [alpha proteobacterium U9-1i]